jgi:glycosyltransferase involved in cell wall biosynthesis
LWSDCRRPLTGKEPMIASDRSGSPVDKSVALAYVGAIVPDRPPYNGSPFSRAGNMSQHSLLSGFISAGLNADIVLSQRPLRAYPASRVLWQRGEWVTLDNGLPAYLVPFVNLAVIRPLTVGLVILARLLAWNWQRRRVPHRVVYVFNLTEPSGLFCWLGARLGGAKVVAWINDINVPGQTVPATWPRRLDFWLQKKIIPSFDGIVAVSDLIIQDFAPGTSYIRVAGGVRPQVLEYFANAPREGREELDGTFTVVFAGSLDEANGVSELLQAFSLLTDPRFRLKIAGAGPLEVEVRDAVQADPRIEYCGYLSFDQVLELYATADVLVNMRITKRLDTQYFFPSKLIEYLATGVPVITTCTGHVGQEYADVAFLLPDESAQGLAEILGHVAGLPVQERIQRARMAQARIYERNTWDAHGRRVLDYIYQHVFGIDGPLPATTGDGHDQQTSHPHRT